MLQIRNESPFAAWIFVFPDEKGIDTLYVVVKASFEITPSGLRVSEKQTPVAVADDYWGEPGQSSLRYPSEAHIDKPATDVILVGDAFAPGGRPATQCGVTVRVGPLRKTLLVFGDRVWRSGLGGQRATAPEPFTRMPLTYERAYGGVHERRNEPALFEPRNPVGRGFRGARGAGDIEGTALPNIEDPSNPIDSPGKEAIPFGVGAVAPSWEPRKSFAGTYDEAWQKTRAPYLPADFDPRFLQFGSSGLSAQGHLRGGEPVEIGNCSPEGMLRFILPTSTLQLDVGIARAVERPPLALETVLLEPNDHRLSVSYRASLPCDKKVLKIEHATIKLTKLDFGGR